MCYRTGTQTGEFEEAEQDIIERVFKLNDRHVERLMIPRTKIVWIDIDDSAEVMQTRLPATASPDSLCARAILTYYESFM